MTTTTIKPSVYLSPKGVAQEYGIPVGSLANLRWRGTGPRYVKRGTKVLYKRADVEEWLESQTVEPVEVTR